MIWNWRIWTRPREILLKCWKTSWSRHSCKVKQSLRVFSLGRVFLFLSACVCVCVVGVWHGLRAHSLTLLCALQGQCPLTKTIGKSSGNTHDIRDFQWKDGMLSALEELIPSPDRFAFSAARSWQIWKPLLQQNADLRSNHVSDSELACNSFHQTLLE